MKLLAVLAKNMKLLFRNKESAFTIIFGPILIILLVSFAFLGATDDYTIRVGTYAPVHTSFSDAVIKGLNQKNYHVSVYPKEDSCVESVQTGAVHACMVFDSEEAGNTTVPVTFYLDLSRTNIIYQIADDLADVVDVQSDVIRSALAGDVLMRLQSASILVEQNRNASQKIINGMTAVADELKTAREALEKVSVMEQNVTDVKQLRGYHLGLGQNVRHVTNISYATLDRSLAMIRELERSCIDCDEVTITRIKQLKDDIDDVQEEMLIISEDTTKKQLADADLLIKYAVEDIVNLESSARNATSSTAIALPNVVDAQIVTGASAKELQRITTKLAYTKEFLEGKAYNEDALAKPIATSIVSVTVVDDRLSFTYPYLLVLVIMFIGMLLSSILIVTDKTSRAAFRNFTTPTSDGYHIFVSFLTAFILLVAEVAVILLLSASFVSQPLLLNIGSTLAILCATIILFTFIGMIIGYLSKTQEAAMIASISVGSILLFVSNIIIPVETMALVVQWLTQFNPYLIMSELLKKSMLYGVSIEQVSRDLFGVLVLIIVLFLCTK